MNKLMKQIKSGDDNELLTISFIFLLSGFLMLIFFTSFASASPTTVDEFLQDNVTKLTITINQSESRADFYINLNGTSIDMQEVSFDLGNTTITSTVSISKLLNDINGQIRVEEGSNISQFDYFTTTQGGLLQITIDLALDYFGYNFTTLDVNNNITLLNDYLLDMQSPIKSDRSIVFTKDLTNYTLWNDRGWRDIDADEEEVIKQIIAENVLKLNYANLTQDFLPFLERGFNTSNLTGQTNSLLMELLGTSLDLEELSNFSIEINTNIELKDGVYKIPVSLIGDGVTYTKEVTLVLSGIEPEEQPPSQPPTTSGSGGSRKSKVSKQVVAESSEESDQQIPNNGEITNPPIEINPKEPIDEDKGRPSKIWFLVGVVALVTLLAYLYIRGQKKKNGQEKD